MTTTSPKPYTPQLVISVRDVNEALMAQRAGADVIDIKEPTRGSLGAADRQVVKEILEQIADTTVVSVACGELAQWKPADSLANDGPIQFAKVGLAGCRHHQAWESLWYRWRKALPGHTRAVMCCYADWQPAGAPSPNQAVAVAAKLGAEGLLFDTWDKTKGHLFEFMTDSQLGSLVEMAAADGLWVALAGKLDATLIRRCLEPAPRYLAFRGAVCRRDRTRQLDESRLRTLVGQIRSISQEHKQPHEQPAHEHL